MWRQVLLLPLLALFSVANAITRFVGKVIPAANVHGWLFDKALGNQQNAIEIRNELISRTEVFLKEGEREIEQSPSELITDIEEARKRTSSVVSSGEFVLAIFFGIGGFYISSWITLLMSLVIALSASLRITAVDSLAISSPDESHSVEWLLAAKGWNEGAIEGGSILFNTASAVGIKEYDERAFAVFIEEVFVPSLEGDNLSFPRVVSRVAPQFLAIAQRKVS